MARLKYRLNKTDDRFAIHVCTIPSATVTQAMAAAGADGVLIDMEHGAVDYGTAHAMIAATAGTDCAPIVRVAENDAAEVKRALDLGAEGICFPLIRTAEDARKAIASMRYPPRGNRGFGPFIAQSRWQSSLPSFRKDTEDQLVSVLLIETREAVDNIEAICAVEGIDLLVTAMFDLSTELGHMGQFDHPEVQAALAKVEKAAIAAGIALGSNALNEDMARALFARGYRGIAGFDLLWLREKTASFKSWTDA
jgi:4-hydroxy-2-oxoheptanedioate aldolase